MATRQGRPGRWHITSRVVAAAIPGFILANVASIFLALLYPGDKLAGVAGAIVSSFAVWTCIVLWVFAVARLRMVWFGLLGATLVCGAGAAGLYFLRAAA